jgi:uncharacterized protein
MKDKLTDSERSMLLSVARHALEEAVAGAPRTSIQLEHISPRLKEPGSSFVTLTRHGELRGCIGSLEPYQPLIEDVREHAVAAALRDYRFPSVQPQELGDIEIEISCLTSPEPLTYDHPLDLPGLLHPGVDGVVLKDGFHRATFLPQVWEKLPDPGEFLSHLCMKMGASSDLWRHRLLSVEIYHVEEFHES